MKELRVLAERWRVQHNTIRPHSLLGYRSPAPEARLTNDPGHGEVETTTRFPILLTPEDGYLNSEITALHSLIRWHKRSGTRLELQRGAYLQIAGGMRAERLSEGSVICVLIHRVEVHLVEDVVSIDF